MTRTELKNSAGESVIVQEGESCVITATLYDTSGAALAKSSIDTLTLTLINESNALVINSRNAEDIYDTNGGAISTAGVVTLKLQPADNAIQVATDGDTETHYARLIWTWTDADAVSLTGVHEYYFVIEALLTPVTSAPSSALGWLG